MSALITLIMNKISNILVFLLILFFTGCTGFTNVRENGYVSMEYDGTYLRADFSDNTGSQFYLRKHSFSYYVSEYFPEGHKGIKILISSGEEFELYRWYSLPSLETADIWESFAMIRYDGDLHKANEYAIAGKVMFTELKQNGSLSFTGEGYCSIMGEFEITLERKELGDTVKIRNGKFKIPESKYWDSRIMED